MLAKIARWNKVLPEVEMKEDFRIYEKYKEFLQDDFVREESPTILVIHGT